MFYIVTFFVKLSSGSSMIGHDYSKEFKLPLSPFVGLEFDFDGHGGIPFGIKVQEVKFHIEDGTVTLWGEHTEDREKEFEKILEYFDKKSNGWQEC